MLDDFLDEQKVVVKILKNAIMKNRLGHAYLFETNGYERTNELVNAFIKSIVCPNKDENLNCVNCTLCEQIDKGIITEIKTIKPDGLWIKKEQILELQKEFKTKSVLINKKIYIIEDVEKLNASSSNALLKFLEEPNPDILAILLTNNLHQLLSTIISRCQVINFSRIDNSQISLDRQLSVEIENLEEFKEIVIKFVESLEKNKLKTIVYTKKLIINHLLDKNYVIAFFDLMIICYKELLDTKILNKTFYFDSSTIETLASLNSLETVHEKIMIVSQLKNTVYNNVNTNLLIDKLIIEIGGIHEYSRNSI